MLNCIDVLTPRLAVKFSGRKSPAVKYATLRCSLRKMFKQRIFTKVAVFET